MPKEADEPSISGNPVGLASSIGSGSLPANVNEHGEEEHREEAADNKQALLMEKLRAKGKIMVQGPTAMMAVVAGQVCEVRAYDPREGAYIVQLPSRQLASVKPTQVVRLKELPPEEEDRTIVSKYSSLKTW
mmetsp:Transcript_48889/g.98368  ORF Transcript_48889/g.98368 Transcript_48889/m.98368 type:complete len:132 (-) Transcript_48889:459-854(-)|eukprot:CAMPEP_0171874720 /NCGR_PEP_ID=MMETSP0992-20121227/35138_1 /TAXON_ID=483369 /ORGANISM="non described non described, Strain CCMP2098" /LENGTH=131 /DNA_ID=CAMNT_0012499571 /DNA_START=31 /DNA_END=423 /DNA_ORIENTATION=+